MTSGKRRISLFPRDEPLITCPMQSGQLSNSASYIDIFVHTHIYIHMHVCNNNQRERGYKLESEGNMGRLRRRAARRGWGEKGRSKVM